MRASRGIALSEQDLHIVRPGALEQLVGNVLFEIIQLIVEGDQLVIRVGGLRHKVGDQGGLLFFYSLNSWLQCYSFQWFDEWELT